MSVRVAATAIGAAGLAALLLVGCASQKAPSPPATQQPEAPTAGSELAGGTAERGDSQPSGEAEAAAASAPGGQAAQPEDPARTETAAGSAADSEDPSPSGPRTAEGGDRGQRTRTSDEQTSDLDGELARALEEFDGILLEEQERLEQQTGAGGGAAGESEAGGGGSGRAGSTSAGTAGPSGQESGGTDPETGGADGGGMVGGSSGSGAEADSEADDRVPPDVGDGSDDDIVARQLREAATAEEDPELRAKLWDEYRRYKESVGGGENDE